jgi:hypothetical protein
MSDDGFRDATPSSAKLLFGIFSESGNGKTLSALLLALGFVGPQGRIGMVETESGRGEIYQGAPLEEYGGPAGVPLRYKVRPIAGNFSPEEYGKAIAAAEKANLDALIIDSASHEWESVGGVLDMAAERSKTMKGPLVWQKPKIDHAKHFVLRLMSSPIPLIIVNMRAKYPMFQVTEKDVAEWKRNGGTGQPPKIGDWARSPKLEPKQSEDILYEMLIHGWIDAEHNFHVTKYPRAIPALRDVVKDGEPLSVLTGKRLAAWAAGLTRAPALSDPQAGEQSSSPAGATERNPADYIAEQEQLALIARCDEAEPPIKIDRLKENLGVQAIADVKKADLERANNWIDRVLAARKTRAAQPTT